MTDPAAKRLQEQGTSRHFLLSKTDTRSLDEQTCPELSEISAALSARFPDLKTESFFIDAAVEGAKSANTFAAMAIRCDRSVSPLAENGKAWSSDDWVHMAEILQEFRPHSKVLWGLIRYDTFGICCADLETPVLLREGRSLQETVRERLQKSVSVGIAGYPCIDYSPAEVIENTLKALDHAAFFGPGSAVNFDAVSLNISGDHFYDRGQFELAIAEFERALLLDAANVNVHNSLGVCFGILGEHQKAKAAFLKAMALDPKEHMAVYNLGQVNLLEGERQLALENFDKANGIQEGVFEIVFQTGKLHLENGAPETGRAYLEEASRLNPDNSQVYRYLGECYSGLGNSAAAIDAYQKAVRANPNDASSLSALGCLLDGNGENREIAMVFCRESVSLAPENALFRHRLGTLYLKHDRLEEALREFRKAELLGYDSSGDIQTTQERMAANQ